MKYEIGDKVFIKEVLHDKPVKTYFTGTGHIIMIGQNNCYMVKLIDWTNQEVICRESEMELL